MAKRALDNGYSPYWPGIPCCSCGKFVGRDGHIEVEYFEMSDEIASVGQRLLPAVMQALGGVAEVALVETRSQIGSGALPIALLPSTALALRPKTGSGTAVEALARALRKLPIPVIGRIEANRLLLDLRAILPEQDETLRQAVESVTHDSRLTIGDPAQ